MQAFYTAKPGRMLRLSAALTLTGALILSGCLAPADQDAETLPDQTTEPSPAEGIEVLKGMGFSLDGLVEKPDGYIVEGDMFISRADLARQRPLGKVAQRVNQVVTTPNPSKLLVAIHSSAASYAAVIHQAVYNWNSLKTRLHLEVVPSGAGNITIYSDASPSCPASLQNLSTSTLALARVATGGNPGSALSINMDNEDMLASINNRVHALTHELGHTIGFRHTGSSEGTHIDGTQDVEGGSIMNSGILGLPALPGRLSHNDIVAMELLYPSDKPLGGTNLDGDTKDDIVVWRPSDGIWYALRSNNNFASGFYWQWGIRTDMPMEDMDVDGDGKDDKVTWHPFDGYWNMVRSSDGSAFSVQWGMRGDVPIANQDMDGDRRDDLVVWRWWEGRFLVLSSRSGFTQAHVFNWGTIGDIPVGGIDTDKDGTDDWVIWRPTEKRFYVSTSGSGFTASNIYNMGQSGDIPVGGNDLDRDGKDDLVLWRPSNGTWYAATSSSNLLNVISNQWGERGDIPLAGSDIDQDGKRDITVWRPSTGVHWVKKSGSNFTTSVTFQWGS